MKRGYAVLGTAILLAASIATAGAQGRRGGGFGGLGMLRSPEVQQELKMTQPQIDKLADAQQKVQQIMQDAGGFQALQGMSAEERAAFMAKISTAQTAAVKDILDQKQFKRYRELELQQA